MMKEKLKFGKLKAEIIFVFYFLLSAFASAQAPRPPVDQFKKLTDVTWPAISDGQLLKRSGNNIIGINAGGGGGVSAFTDLSDVPASYSGQSGKVVTVKGTEDGLQFSAAGGGSGTVTSIATTAPITGGTITSTGTIGLDVSVDHQFTNSQTITRTDAGTVNVVQPLTLTHNSSATPSANFGVGVEFQLETSTTTVTAAIIAARWSDATNATRTSYYNFSLLNSGSIVNAMRLYADGALTVGHTTDPGVPGVYARFIPRANAVTSATSWTPDSDTYDQEAQTALAGNLTVNAPSGTPSDGKKLILRIKSDSSSHTITWNGDYVAIGVTLPTTIAASKRIYVGCDYNSNASKWDVLAVAVEP